MEGPTGSRSYSPARLGRCHVHAHRRKPLAALTLALALALALAALALAALASAAALAAALAGFLPAATASELRLRAEYTNMRAEYGVVRCTQSTA